MYPIVSTHSRLKAAGVGGMPPSQYTGVSTHSRLKAAGRRVMADIKSHLFQHTAA